MGKWTKWIWGVVATFPLAAQAQVDLAALDRDMVGPRAQVLVLGTVHLSGMPAGFNPASLDGVLNRLAAFKPDIITIETGLAPHKFAPMLGAHPSLQRTGCASR